jgi:hypothetical protein
VTGKPFRTKCLLTLYSVHILRGSECGGSWSGGGIG